MRIRAFILVTEAERKNKEENKTERSSRTEAISGWRKRDT